MRSARDSVATPPRAILLPFYLEESAQGLTLGLYLYVYGKFVRDAAADVHFADLFFGVLTLCILLFEPITGYVADAKGRAFSLRLSFLLRSAFFILMFCAWTLSGSSDVWFKGVSIGAAVVFAVSYTLRSGALDAWLYDALDGIGQRESYTRVYARGNQYLWSCFLLGSFAGVYLQDTSYIGDFAVGAELGYTHVAFLFGGFVSLSTYFFLSTAIDDSGAGARSLDEGGPKDSGDVLLKSFVDGVYRSVCYITREKGLAVLTIAGGFAMMLMDASDFLWRPFFEDLRTTTPSNGTDWYKWFALLLFAGATNAGNIGLARVLGYYHGRSGGEIGHVAGALLTGGCFLSAAVVVLLATVWAPFPFVIAMLLIQFLDGVSRAPLSGMQNAWIASGHPLRATILSTIEGIRNGLVALAFFVWEFSAGFDSWYGPAVVLCILTPFVMLWHPGRGTDETR